MHLQRCTMCLALSLLLGCAGRPPAHEPVAAPVVAPVADAAPAHAPVEAARKDDDIIEAVLRYEWARFASYGRTYDFVFVELPNQQDPCPELLARFAGHEPPVLPVSLGEKGMHGVRHKERKGRGLILHVKEIRWQGSDSVEARGGHFANGRDGSGKIYYLERQQGRWVVTDARTYFAS